MEIKEFDPLTDVTTVAATTTSSSAQALRGSAMNGECQLRVVNEGATTAFVALGASGMGAATAANGRPVLGGSERIFRFRAPHTHARVILASGTGNVYLQLGTGV